MKLRCCGDAKWQINHRVLFNTFPNELVEVHVFDFLCKMKKNNILFIIVFYSIQSIWSQVPNFYKERVVSDVKSISKEKYSAIEKKGKLKIKRSTKEYMEFQYDTSHLLVNFLGWYPNASKYYRIEEYHNRYLFDSLGRVIKKISIDYYKPPLMNADTQMVKSTYKFHCRTDSIFGQGLLTSVRKVFEDDLGRNKLFIELNVNEEIIEKHIYNYDDRGNLSLDTTYTSGDSMCCIRRFVYDRRGNEIFTIVYHPNGDYFDYENYEYDYDNRGNWVKRRIYFSGKLDSVVTREFEYRN